MRSPRAFSRCSAATGADPAAGAGSGLKRPERGWGNVKRIVLLGATGSIGRSVCDVVRAHRDEFRIVAAAVRSSRAAAEEIGREFGARVYAGEGSAARAVAENVADVAVVATVGLSGLEPTLLAIDRGMTVALATKETLVAAGELVMARARARGVTILPVDSEHSAVFQCLQENCAAGAAWSRSVSRLVLTASGGPFLDGPADLSAVTPAQALAHPRWKMGPKVTVDSSTMMNKGFEILEARWLFGVPTERIDVVVHPESVVHSLVEFEDGATLAQLSPPDMRVPIQYALTWPVRLPAARARLDLAALGALTFRAPDETRFPALKLVKDAAAAGGTRTAVLSAADEVAVARFLAGEISYPDVVRLVREAVERAPETACDGVESVLAADAWARSYAAAWRARGAIFSAT